jgi:hypothetical protein
MGSLGCQSTDASRITVREHLSITIAAYKESQS